MISLRHVLTIAGFAAVAVGPAAAQVAYNPYAYGYPVPGGVLQPDETLGTSPSFEIFPNPYGYAPAVRVVPRCQYPDGWNVTDFSRDVNGIPAGIHHTCPEVLYRPRVRARY